MSSDRKHPRRLPRTAAERRRQLVDGGPLFEQVRLAEQRLLEEQPELYALLSRMTLSELEEFALKNK